MYVYARPTLIFANQNNNTIILKSLKILEIVMKRTSKKKKSFKGFDISKVLNISFCLVSFLEV